MMPFKIIMSITTTRSQLVVVLLTIIISMLTSFYNIANTLLSSLSQSTAQRALFL